MSRIEQTVDHAVEQTVELSKNPAALLRIATVQSLTGLSRTTIYCKAAQGEFPSPLKLGSRCSRWRASSISEWLEAVK
ncbi:helix-turn-helix transcriptional regulator [Variovorax paradoxus]|uniref:Phage transcriptional regulator, AlpA n=1 Tax=Variovorax paradoxus (strain EPS) TaxID=595537 RepID=E6V3R3_VARPE|nr:AlpA family phage regulatory protein [Variovorax paradoxus]ADU36937.1 phage transcriptional regulator, AlpA [Variovorax paradoxus EPS]